MILFFDTETTGLLDFKLPADHPAQPRIASIAAVLFDDGRVPVGTMHDFVRPDGWAVPPDVTRINGLTTQRLAEIGIPIAEALANFLALYERADELIAYGAEFDLKMLRGELRRAGLPDHYKGKPAKCAMRRATHACRMPPTQAMLAAGRKTNKTPKLTEAHEIILGSPVAGAHDALNDVMALSRIWFRLVDNPEWRRELAAERQAREAAESRERSKMGGMP